MTALPAMAERRPAYLQQKSVSQFSQSGVQQMQNDAGWAAGPSLEGAAVGPNVGLITGGAGPAAIAYGAVRSSADSIAAKNRALLVTAAATEADSDVHADGTPASLKPKVCCSAFCLLTYWLRHPDRLLFLLCYCCYDKSSYLIKVFLTILLDVETPSLLLSPILAVPGLLVYGSVSIKFTWYIS